MKLNGSQPSRQHQAPIYVEENHYRDRGTKQISGLDPVMSQIIDALQPFKQPEEVRRHYLLWSLDELCNINKHRHIFSTVLHSKMGKGEIPPRHYLGSTLKEVGDDEKLAEMCTFVAFAEGTVQELEVAAVLERFSAFVIEKCIQPFDFLF